MWPHASSIDTCSFRFHGQWRESLSKTAQQPTKALAKVVREKRIEDRVDTTVHVGEAVGGQLDADVWNGFWVDSEGLDDEDQLNRKPANGEYEDDDDNHPCDPPLGSHRFRRLGSPSDPSMQETLDHDGVQDGYDGERNEEGECEEAAVEQLAVVGDLDEFGILAEVLVPEGHNLVLLQDGRVAEADDQPGRPDGQVGIAYDAQRHRLDWVDHGQVAIQGHEDQRVDARVGGHVYDVLIQFAENSSEGPVGDDESDGGEWDADDDEDEVGNCEVDDEHVGRVLHLLVAGDDDDDEDVADETEEGDESENDRDDHSDDLLEQLIRLGVLHVEALRRGTPGGVGVVRRGTENLHRG